MTSNTAAKAKTRTPSRSGGKRLAIRFIYRPLRWVRRIAIAFFIFTCLLTLLLGVMPPPFTPLMVIRCAQQWTGDQPVRLKKDWTPLEEMSPYLLQAVIAAEDQQFFQHRGFDWDGILSAFAVNMKGKRKLGASTISQQTAKNLYLWPTRSWARKGLEAYFTVLMETTWSKRRILAVYLNVIETGNGIYGMEAASQHYFGVSAAKVDRRQAALLAAVLPNPRRWSPERPTPYLMARQAWILRQMELGAGIPQSNENWRIRKFIRTLIGDIVKLF